MYKIKEAIPHLKNLKTDNDFKLSRIEKCKATETERTDYMLKSQALSLAIEELKKFQSLKEALE